MQDRHKEEFDFIKKTATEVFLQDGYHQPMLFLIHPSGVQMHAFECLTEQTKESLAGLIRSALSNSDFQAAIFVSETWMATSSDEEVVRDIVRHLQDKGTLEGHPHTTEALTLNYNDGTNVELYYAPILRDGDAGPRLGEWDELTSEKDRLEGRLAPRVPRPEWN